MPIGLVYTLFITQYFTNRQLQSRNHRRDQKTVGCQTLKRLRFWRTLIRFGTSLPPCSYQEILFQLSGHLYPLGLILPYYPYFRDLSGILQETLIQKWLL